MYRCEACKDKNERPRQPIREFIAVRGQLSPNGRVFEGTTTWRCTGCGREGQWEGWASWGSLGCEDEGYLHGVYCAECAGKRMSRPPMAVGEGQVTRTTN